MLRFPGGCVAEGDSFERWFDWKRTVGALERRETIWNIWGYWQSFGLGYYEYFCLAEDIGAEPFLADVAPESFGGAHVVVTVPPGGHDYTVRFEDAGVNPPKLLSTRISSCRDALRIRESGGLQT